jgi:hypothetical protein
MEFAPYLEGLRRDLVAAAAPGGPEVQRAAELLVGSLEASARLFLLEALSDAAAEITATLAGSPDPASRASVEIRMRGRDAQVVVSEPAVAPKAAPAPPADIPDSGDLARITLRLPEQLKEAVERLAAAESISTNAWLVRAIGQLVSGAPAAPPSGNPPPGRGRLGRRITGYAQA